MHKYGFYIFVGFFGFIILMYFINFFNFYDESYKLDSKLAVKCITEICFYEDLVTYKCYYFKEPKLIQVGFMDKSRKNDVLVLQNLNKRCN